MPDFMLYFGWGKGIPPLANQSKQNSNPKNKMTNPITKELYDIDITIYDAIQELLASNEVIKNEVGGKNQALRNYADKLGTVVSELQSLNILREKAYYESVTAN